MGEGDDGQHTGIQAVSPEGSGYFVGTGEQEQGRTCPGVPTARHQEKMSALLMFVAAEDLSFVQSRGTWIASTPVCWRG